MIETAQLIHDTVTNLAPALPFLLKAAEGASESIGKKIGGAAANKALQIWHWLRPKTEQNPALLEAASKAASAPGDENALSALRSELRNLLHAQPHLVQELSTIIAPMTQANKVSATGTGAIAVGGSVSDSSLNTNVSE
jgi:hypothetical protein